MLFCAIIYQIIVGICHFGAGICYFVLEYVILCWNMLFCAEMCHFGAGICYFVLEYVVLVLEYVILC
jgi:hypothetical protein